MANSTQKIHYDSIDDRDILVLIQKSREGIKYAAFSNLQKDIPLKSEEWSRILHLSERTLLRYKKEKIGFSPIYSERIIEVQLLFNKGVEVFGSTEKFYDWFKKYRLGWSKPSFITRQYFWDYDVKG
jgi:uncharacterized protein (DUF2384 family)